MTTRRRRPAPSPRARRTGADDILAAGGILLLGLAVYVTWAGLAIKLHGGHIGRAGVPGFLLSATVTIALGAWLGFRAYRLSRPLRVRIRQRRLKEDRRARGPVAYSREPIPAGMRFAVLRRDGFRCAYCGRGESDGAKLHLDHIVPVARGGKTEIGNLVTACAECNIGKSASDLVGGP